MCVRTNEKQSKKDGLSPRKGRIRDIVILLRATKYNPASSRRFSAAQGFPSRRQRQRIFESTEVRDMLALLELLENSPTGYSTGNRLRSPLLAFAMRMMRWRRIRAANPATKTRSAFHEATLRYANAAQDHLAEQLRNFFHSSIAGGNSARRPLAEVIWQIYRKPAISRSSAGLIDGQQREQICLPDQRAAQFGNFRQHGVAGFLTFLRELEDVFRLRNTEGGPGRMHPPARAEM